MHKMMMTAAVVALVAGGCTANDGVGRPETSTTAASITAVVRTPHTPDLAALTKRFSTPAGFMDPAFPPTVAVPSPYLSDFFGLQAIQDVPRETIIADFTPALGSVVAQDDASVTVQMRESFSARFYPVSSLAVAGFSVPVSHVGISGDDWRTLRSNLNAFVAALEKARLAKRYLVPNPDYPDEQSTYRQMTRGSAATIVVDPELVKFDASSDGVLLLGEGVHGKPDDVLRAIEVLNSHKVEWLGLEMVNQSSQPQFDRYNSARPGSPDFAAARSAVVQYFAENWNGRAGPKTTGEKNLYFKLAEVAHARGTRIVGVEGSTLPFLLFRFGETAFGGAVRSQAWAKATPARGRGMIFGGSAHFNDATPASVQDFLVAQNPGRPMFSIRPIAKKKSG